MEARKEACDPRVERYTDYVQSMQRMQFEACLLYTSDAADERSSVDLGGRRIIKKKNNEKKKYFIKI